MKKIIIALSLLASAPAWSVFPALPFPLSKLDQPITLRLVPNATVRCTKTDQFEGGKTKGGGSEPFLIELSKDRTGNTKLFFGNDSIKVGFPVKGDGSGFINSDPVIETNLPTSAQDLAQELQRYRPFLNVFTDFYSAFIGKSLQQNISAPLDLPDVCPLLTGNPAKEKLFSTLTVLGQTQLKKRPTLVVAGDAKFICTAQNVDSLFEIKGWYAIDIKSGLETSRSEEIKLGYTSIFSTTDCTFAGGALPAPTTGNLDRTVEDRLRELKGLYDKGLITKDQFEKRSSQILENL